MEMMLCVTISGKKNKIVVGKGDSILEAVQDLKGMLMEERYG